MTKEELEKEAEEYYFDRLDPKAIDSISEINDANTESLIISAYLASAEPREKRIAELEAQIEKMECCENCAFFKDKTYDICHRIKKLGTRKCTFYKMI